MSHVLGQILDMSGEIVGHFEYNGTVDVGMPKIFATIKECEGAWRKDQPTPCECHGRDVTLVCGGLTWSARACLDHGFIVHGTSPLYGEEDEDRRRPRPDQ